MRKRDNRVSVRYTDAEYDELMKKVSYTGQSRQDYMLNCSLGARLTTETERNLLREEVKLLADLDRQLRGVGTNINQLAYKANSCGYDLDAEKLSKLAEEVVQTREEMMQTWLSIRQLRARQNRMVE